MHRALPALAVTAACSHWVSTTHELKPGECAAEQAQSGGTCSEGVIETAVVATATAPRDSRLSHGVMIYGRHRLLDFGLDVGSVRRETTPPVSTRYLTVGGDVGIHVPLMAFCAPNLARYIELAPTAGLDLGLINFSGEVRPRGDGWYGGFVELTAPDFGPFKFTEHGVPGLHLGIRRVAYVQEWSSATVLDIGFVWRWGEPIELHTYKYYRMSLD